MDTTPDSQFDQLTKKVNTLEIGLSKANETISNMGSAILRTLEGIKKQNESEDLRISEVLHRVLSSVVHELGHSIDKTREQLSQLERGFDIFPVDGHNVQENDKTVLVRRTSETTYDYSMAATPETVVNEGTERFTEWFNANPEVMGDRDEIYVNIVGYTKEVQPTAPVEV